MKWFQLDSDMPHDPKIRSILETFGNSGLGALIRLFCFVADHGKRPGWAIDSHGKPFEKASVIQAMGITQSEFDEIMSKSTQLGLVSKNGFDKRGLIVIPAMATRASNYEKVRRRLVDAHSTSSGRRIDVNKTTQDKTIQDARARASNGSLRSPGGSGPNARTTGSHCAHTPRCATFNACVTRTITEARAAKSRHAEKRQG